MIALLLVSPVVSALESIGPSGTHNRETSAPEEFSLKPVRLYSERNRRDPFVLASYDKARLKDGKNISESFKPELKELSISRLELTGFSSANGQRWALFKQKDSRNTYVLKLGRFYTSGNKRLKNVWGRILPNDEVLLRQGERKLVFKNFRKDRRSQ